jgi:hypothetical protein
LGFVSLPGEIFSGHFALFDLILLLLFFYCFAEALFAFGVAKY